jgi:hypothetical protein
VSADFAPGHFEQRFLVPAVPLLVAGGAVALRDLVVAVQRQRPTAPVSECSAPETPDGA